MIKIVIDSENLDTKTNVNRLASIEEFPRSVDKILRSYANNQELTLYVSHATIINWLQKMADRYPQGVFVFDTIDARFLIAQRWNVNVPDSVKNEDILQAGLLSLDIHQQPGSSFDDLLLAIITLQFSILRHFHSPNWLPFLLRWMLKSGRRTGLIQLLARTLHARIEEWKNKARSSEQRQMIDWFATDPAEFKHLLMQFRVLHYYPSIAEGVLGEKYHDSGHAKTTA